MWSSMEYHVGVGISEKLLLRRKLCPYKDCSRHAHFRCTA
uniref:Uncharacterized protein n=1 Tax=Anguilla anguilla TaxID=7936 RepID=A0A0E9T3D6_ANGAN